MKFRIHQAFLSLFFVLAFCFSFSIEASAHDYLRSDGQHTYTHSEDINISASEVGIADEAQMKLFVRHVATHLDLIQKDTDLDEEARQEQSREITIFGRKAREAGPFNNGVDIYSIGVTPRGAITSHGLHGNLLGYRYDSSQAPLMTLLADTVPKLSDDVDPVCATYDSGTRVACAVRQDTLAGVITTVTGLHHGEDDYAQAPNCDDFTIMPTAKQLEDETDPDTKKELLKQFVKGIISITEKVILDTGIEVISAGFNPLSREGRLETAARMFEKFPCFRSPDLRYGSVYGFIMDPREGVAFMNGNDFTRNGLSVSLNDPNPPSYDGKGNIEPNVLTAIHRTLTDTPPPNPIPTDSDGFVDVEDGDSGVFTYHWAHPDRSLGLDTPDYLERCVVPGRALKESYIEVKDVAPSGSPQSFLLVFGSGFYQDQEKEDIMPDDGSNLCPVTETDDGDDGCAIAAAGNTPRSALFNLFLIASVLFSAVLLRRRA